MYYYSNNYSKFIEELKLEKSKKAFTDMVESTISDKEEKIIISNTFEGKEGAVSVSYQDTSDSKSSEDVSFKNDSISKENLSLPFEDNIPDSKEYSSIQKRISVDESGKQTSKVESVEVIGNSKAGSKVSYSGETSGKIGKSVSFKDESSSNYEDRRVSYKNEVSNKENIDVNNPNVPSGKEDEEVASVEISSSKSIVSIIDSIKNEKKSDNNLNNRILRGQKEGDGLDYQVKDPQKLRQSNLEKIFDESRNGLQLGIRKYGGGTRTYEEQEYEKYASSTKYYPYKSYSEMNADNMESIEDIFHRIVTPSNWNQGAGTAIVNGLRIATDIADLMGGFGTDNIYKEGVTANNLRWKLELNNRHDNFNNKKSNLIVAPEDPDGVGEETKDFNGDASKKSDIIKLGEEDDGVEYVDSIAGEKTDEDKNITNNFIKKEESKNKIKSIEKCYIDETDDEGSWESTYEITQFADTKNRNDGYKKTEEEISTTDDFENKDDKSEIIGITGEDANGISSTKDLTEISENRPKSFSYNKDFDKGFNRKKIEYSLFEENDNDDSEGINRTKAIDLKLEPIDAKRWFDSEDIDSHPVGHIYVCSPFESSISEPLQDSPKPKMFKIPLQNNLSFEQISRAATYNAIQFFGRIGDVQQFVRTGSLDAITLTTKYFMEDNSTSGRTYNIKNLQMIENMYKSLVLPDEDEIKKYNDNYNYTYFTKPPIINIVLGQEITSQNYGFNGPYKNLFTNIMTVGDGDRTSIYYKNFVVTNIAIDKNQNDYNFYIIGNNDNDNDRDYVDTTGFTVTLTVLEIDENYLTSSPSFANYYNTFKKYNQA